MNYFAHGRMFVDDPYFLAGTAVPDWLNVAARRVRVRSKVAVRWIDHQDPTSAALARGIVQHHHDDRWFHDTTAFNALQWQLTVLVRDQLGDVDGLRPSFLGHILVELLLDAALITDDPAELTRYYEAVARVDGAVVAAAVAEMATPCERLAWFVDIFSREQFLWDYLDDGKLWRRLNQVMQRVGLPQLPPSFAELLPAARTLVNAQRSSLLTPEPRVVNDAANASTY